jgi:hypothetical protein
MGPPGMAGPAGAAGAKGDPGVAGPTGPAGPQSWAAVADGPPSNPAPGQLWWESDTGNLFVWYVDANTSQWVQINAAPAVTPGHVRGEPGSGKAAAGEVGELIEKVAYSVGIPGTGVPFNVTSIVLTPGDWDVSGYVLLLGAPLTVQQFVASYSAVSATIAGDYSSFTGPFIAFYNLTETPIPTQFSISVATTVYLVAQMTYNAGSGSVQGKIRARRMR